MIRPTRKTFSLFTTAVLAGAVVAGCSTGTPTPGPSRTPVIVPLDSSTPSAVSSASGSASASGSPGASASDSGGPTLALPHTDAALEALLPDSIGGIALEKFSLKLSSYISSSSGGDRDLYAPWLVEYGKTPDEVNMAVAGDLTQTENFTVRAIGVSGASDASLASGFADVARKAGWPVSQVTVAGEPLLEMTDPSGSGAAGVSIGYVFARDHVLYSIITDDANLLVEALGKLFGQGLS
jgi:hypothetical protein